VAKNLGGLDVVTDKYSCWKSNPGRPARSQSLKKMTSEHKDSRGRYEKDYSV
jgi:hypothetical protein